MKKPAAISSLIATMAMMGTTTQAFTVVGGGYGTTRGQSAAANTILKMSSSSSSATAAVTPTDANSSSSTTTTASDFQSAMPEEVDPHDIIGVEPEKLALGIDPYEFLEWVGTYVCFCFCLLHSKYIHNI